MSTETCGKEKPTPREERYIFKKWVSEVTIVHLDDGGILVIGRERDRHQGAAKS